jgi:hypothetical protein
VSGLKVVGPGKDLREVSEKVILGSAPALCKLSPYLDLSGARAEAFE